MALSVSPYGLFPNTSPCPANQAVTFETLKHELEKFFSQTEQLSHEALHICLESLKAVLNMKQDPYSLLIQFICSIAPQLNQEQFLCLRELYRIANDRFPLLENEIKHELKKFFSKETLTLKDLQICLELLKAALITNPAPNQLLNQFIHSIAPQLYREKQIISLIELYLTAAECYPLFDSTGVINFNRVRLLTRALRIAQESLELAEVEKIQVLIEFCEQSIVYHSVIINALCKKNPYVDKVEIALLKNFTEHEAIMESDSNDDKVKAALKNNFTDFDNHIKEYCEDVQKWMSEEKKDVALSLLNHLHVIFEKASSHKIINDRRERLRTLEVQTTKAKNKLPKSNNYKWNRFRERFQYIKLTVKNPLEFSQLFTGLLHDIFEYCYYSLGNTAPCHFQVILLGSLTRLEATPLSDIDCAFLIQDPQFRIEFVERFLPRYLALVQFYLNCLDDQWVVNSLVDDLTIARVGCHIDEGDIKFILGCESNIAIVIRSTIQSNPEIKKVCYNAIDMDMGIIPLVNTPDHTQKSTGEGMLGWIKKVLMQEPIDDRLLKLCYSLIFANPSFASSKTNELFITLKDKLVDWLKNADVRRSICQKIIKHHLNDLKARFGPDDKRKILSVRKILTDIKKNYINLFTICIFDLALFFEYTESRTVEEILSKFRKEKRFLNHFIIQLENAWQRLHSLRWEKQKGWAYQPDSGEPSECILPGCTQNGCAPLQQFRVVEITPFEQAELENIEKNSIQILERILLILSQSMLTDSFLTEPYHLEFRLLANSDAQFTHWITKLPKIAFSHLMKGLDTVSSKLNHCIYAYNDRQKKLFSQFIELLISGSSCLHKSIKENNFVHIWGRWGTLFVDDQEKLVSLFLKRYSEHSQFSILLSLLSLTIPKEKIQDALCDYIMNEEKDYPSKEIVWVLLHFATFKTIFLNKKLIDTVSYLFIRKISFDRDFDLSDRVQEIIAANPGNFHQLVSQIKYQLKEPKGILSIVETRYDLFQVVRAALLLAEISPPLYPSIVEILAPLFHNKNPEICKTVVRELKIANLFSFEKEFFIQNFPPLLEIESGIFHNDLLKILGKWFSDTSKHCHIDILNTLFGIKSVGQGVEALLFFLRDPKSEGFIFAKEALITMYSRYENFIPLFFKKYAHDLSNVQALKNLENSEITGALESMSRRTENNPMDVREITDSLLNLLSYDSYSLGVSREEERRRQAIRKLAKIWKKKKDDPDQLNKVVHKLKSIISYDVNRFGFPGLKYEAAIALFKIQQEKTPAIISQIISPLIGKNVRFHLGVDTAHIYDTLKEMAENMSAQELLRNPEHFYIFFGLLENPYETVLHKIFALEM